MYLFYFLVKSYSMCIKLCKIANYTRENYSSFHVRKAHLKKILFEVDKTTCKIGDIMAIVQKTHIT